MDTAFGDSGDDYIDGGKDDDDLDGGPGNDVILGRQGDDTLNGGAGNDILRGGAGMDTLNGEGDGDLLDGGKGADALNGSAGGDLLLGRQGADTLKGNGGEDYLFGGWGNDHLSGGSADDIVVGSQGQDVVHGSGGDDLVVGGGTKNMQDFLLGSATPLTMDDIDDGEADILVGGTGEDTLILGKEDVAFGGDDADKFIVLENKASTAAATIRDFNPAEDTLVIDYLPADYAVAPTVTVTDFADGTGADILLDGVVVASVTGAQGLAPGAVTLEAFV